MYRVERMIMNDSFDDSFQRYTYVWVSAYGSLREKEGEGDKERQRGRETARLRHHVDAIHKYGRIMPYII